MYSLFTQHALHFCLELDKACKVRCFCEDFFSLELLILLLVPVLSSVHAESVVFFLFLAVHLICSIYLGGINGAIRKVGMLISLVLLALVDSIIRLNLIGFIPAGARTYLPGQTVGTMEFFALLYIAYEIVSILKNMSLCGLPVKKVWRTVKKALSKYTNELPTDSTN